VRKVLAFITKTYLYILILPILFNFLGAASNQLVLNANNDTFPVRVNERKIAEFTQGQPVVLSDGTVMLDDTHCVMSSKTHLNLLADVIDFKGEGILSVGDLLLELGEFLGPMAPYLWGLAMIIQVGRKYTAEVA